MPLSVDPTRRVEDYGTLREGNTAEVIYRHTWTGTEHRHTGEIAEVVGPRHDRSYVVEPVSEEITMITIHSRHGSAGTVDGEPIHEMAVAAVE